MKSLMVIILILKAFMIAILLVIIIPTITNEPELSSMLLLIATAAYVIITLTSLWTLDDPLKPLPAYTDYSLTIGTAGLLYVSFAYIPKITNGTIGMIFMSASILILNTVYIIITAIKRKGGEQKC